jgi:hypothetical protein
MEDSTGLTYLEPKNSSWRVDDMNGNRTEINTSAPPKLDAKLFVKKFEVSVN